MEQVEQVFFNVPLVKLEPIFKRWVREVQLEFHTEEESTPFYLTRKEVADKLQLSLISVDKYAKQGILKSYRIGGAIRFKSSEVDKALEEVRNAKYRRA